jgi:deaminated glutathione amidase
MTWNLRVAALQMTSSSDLQSNLLQCERLSAQAADQGAQLITLPECFAFLGTSERDKLAVAESIEAIGTASPITDTLQRIAQRHKCWLMAGGMPERVTADKERSYNTAVIVSPSGEITAQYRKIHLFDVDIPGGAVMKESATTAAGNKAVVTEIAGVKVGLSICYDVRFPELYRQLVAAGAEILLVPAAFTAHTGRAHWHLLLRARAIENQCWVVAPAQVGIHNAKRETYGHSLIVDPWGTVVAELPSGTGVIVSDLSGAAIATRRTQMPCLQHAALLNTT